MVFFSKFYRKVQQFQLLERKMYSKMFSEQKASGYHYY